MNPWILHSAGSNEIVSVLEFCRKLENVSITKNQALGGKRNRRLRGNANSGKEWLTLSLKDRLVEDMKAAMKAKEEGKVRLSVIRMARAAIKNAEIEKKQEFNDEQVIEVLAREVKIRRDAIEEFTKAGRPEKVQELQEEVAILMEYLPQQLSEGEIRQMAQEIIAEVGAQGPKDIGKVMSVIAPKTKGRADGKLVNQIVRELLGS